MLFRSPPLVYLAPSRAQTLRIPLYTVEAVAIALPSPITAAKIRALADPSSDLDHPMKGPFDVSRTLLPESAPAALGLAKLAGLLPAAIGFAVADAGTLPSDICRVHAGDIFAFAGVAARDLALVVRARVPLDGAEDAELAAFRPRDGGQEH